MKSKIKPVMIRSFLPVGQGAFCLEQFGRGAKKINVVYDCGSTTGIHLVNKQIDDTFEPGETIHAVFISHLHEDHVNGLPHLLKRCRVQRLFFPLLTEESKILLILQYLSGGKGHAADFVPSFIQSPEAALEQWLGPEDSITLYPVIPNDDAGSEPSERRSGRISVEPVKSGQSVAHMIGINISEWRYIPFNFREQNRREILEAELVKIFGSSYSPKDLLDEYNRNPRTMINKMQTAYKAVPGGFNTNSLVLFSGREDLRTMQCIGGRRCCHIRCLYSSCLPGGCLYTGDYEAAGPAKWKELEDAYKGCCDYIGCLQLPHHGSWRNFNVRLLDFPRCELYIASAGYRNKYRHPHGSVIRNILVHGKHPIIVNEHPGSALHLCVFIK